MMKNLLPLVVSASMAMPAAAQELTQLSYFTAEIGPEDFYNSKGVRLNNFGAVLAQDRANVHRFGIRHPGDEIDPIFGDRAQRARIPELYAAHGRAPGFEQMVKDGQSFRLSVFVCGRGTTIDFIALAGEGEDHSGCF